MAKRHVIIGAGPAGINAMTTIRELESEESEITLVTREQAYARMVLPYFIAGEIPEGQVQTGDEAYFARLKVKTLFGRSVASVRSDRNEVVLDDGIVLPYDDLLIATGSSATSLPIQGVNLDGVTQLWTLEDARSLLAAGGGRKRKEVAFIGAGFIGFIILNAAWKAGWKVHVVEIADQVLPRMLDRPSASLVEAWLARQGVGVHTAAKVAAIVPGRGKGKKKVQLQDGSAIPADAVVLATGIRPNLKLVEGTGVRTGQGILVDDRMQTSVPNVYAAGDVAEGPDLLTGGRAVHAIQPTAVEHGKVAGANMAGRDVRYWGSLLINILDVCRLQCASFGAWGRHDDVSLVANESRPVYRKLVWSGDVLTGAIFLGPAQDIAMLNDLGMVKGLIQTRSALGPWKRYLQDNPLDIRRPYVASQAASKLLKMTITGQASSERGYRHQGLQPVAKPNPHHAAYVGTQPQ
ncbi:MAG: NAD(P)/FAD-dependent oxidoreductase [Planctomycetes bacterium]|nr:NAD(P)/FAD-dependent oxidoreductase [Planctomycetota bacterium]